MNEDTKSAPIPAPSCNPPFTPALGMVVHFTFMDMEWEMLRVAPAIVTYRNGDGSLALKVFTKHGSFDRDWVAFTNAPEGTKEAKNRWSLPHKGGVTNDEFSLMFETLLRLEGRLDSLERLILQQAAIIRQEIEAMTPELKALQDQVAATTEVAASAVTLIHGLADQIAAHADDPAAMNALAASLKASSDDLAAAVAANTPAPAPEPEPAPEPAPES